MGLRGEVDRYDLYEKVAQQMGVPKVEIEKAVKAQFKMVRNTVAEGLLKSIRLPRFGVFRVKKRRMDHILGNQKVRDTLNERTKEHFAKLDKIYGCNQRDVP